MKLEFFFRRILVKYSNIKFPEIRPVGAELFHADRRTNATHMTKVIVAFRNFANAHKNEVNQLALCCEYWKTVLVEQTARVPIFSVLPKRKCQHNECLSQVIKNAVNYSEISLDMELCSERESARLTFTECCGR